MTETQSIRTCVAHVYRDHYELLLRRHALWSRNQGKEEAEIVASLIRTRRRLDQPVPLARLLKIARGANRQPRDEALNDKHDPVEMFLMRQFVAQARPLIEVLDWRGLFGQHCYWVVRKLLDLMETTGKAQVNEAGRTLSDDLGMDEKTAACCLRALCGLRVRQKTSVPAVLVRQSRNRAEEPAKSYSYTLRPISCWHTSPAAAQSLHSPQSRGNCVWESWGKFLTCSGAKGVSEVMRSGLTSLSGSR